MKRYYLFGGLSILILSFIFIPTRALAVEDFNLHFTSEAIVTGYTAEYNQQDHPEWGNFRVGIVPNLVNEPIDLVLKKFNGDNFPDPVGRVRVSDYYIFDILREDQVNKDPLKLNRPFVLSVKMDDLKNYYRKRIYYWSSPAQEWVALPSSADYDNGYIRAYTHLPFSRIAVFEDSPEIDNYGLEGKASFLTWNRHPDGVASNDYPIGTKLRVRNVDNGKVVDVTVYSTGPFVDFNQRRILDLSRISFLKIEDTWKGLVRIQIWPIGDGVKVLGVDTYSLRDEIPSEIFQPATVPEPNPGSAAVIAINEKTEEIIYSKNYDTILPLASITKLMTAVVFLDTGTSMDKVITYDEGDNAIGSKLRVSPGETMLVKDIYFTMLVGSANNAANTLARVSGLTRDEFIQKMNDKVKSWGLDNTNFVDVSGLDPANVSTVYEIAKLAKHAFKDFRILQGTTSWSYAFKTINTGQPHIIDNTSKGMKDSSLYITGMKTGYLDEAGYCFVLKARGDSGSTNNVITVVLGAESLNQRYDDTKALINYALTKI